ncbi:MAG: hypothetical protein ACHQ2Z_07260, partial [Elusimicrobiota bacterium]
MDKVIEAFRHPNVWAVSVQLLILYCVSVALFFAVDGVGGGGPAQQKEGRGKSRIPQPTKQRKKTPRA